MNFVCYKQKKVNKKKQYFLFLNSSFIFTDDPYSEFKEAAINFPPTYKFDLRSNGDTYNKYRIPSYTVRIEI